MAAGPVFGDKILIPDRGVIRSEAVFHHRCHPCGNCMLNFCLHPV
jgi:hypothetical protein